MNPVKTTLVLAAAVMSLVGLPEPAHAQYYAGYYQPPVYRTMPVRPVLPPAYRVPTYRPYDYPYPGRPVPTFPRGTRGSGTFDAPSYRPGVVTPCRGTRNNGVCYGGGRPGAW